MVVLYLHEPKTPRHLMNLELEMREKGALKTWNPQIMSYQRMGLSEIKDGKHILMILLTFQLISHQFRDLQEHLIQLLQVSLIQPGDKGHWEKTKTKIHMPFMTFRITLDLHQIYLQSFLLGLKVHLHLNQDLLQCPLTE